MNRYLRKIALSLSEKKGKFLTFYERPIYAEGFGLWSDTLKNEPKTAIILQGQIIEKHDFTLETVRVYRKLFPNALIILSTWSDSPAAALTAIKAEGIEILENTKPSFSGQQNINLQIISSLAGVMHAKERGMHYVLKTRTDQRMYAPNSLAFLRGMLEVFPLKNSSIQQQRLVAVSLNTFKYRPYGLSDMTLFGCVDDMILFWSAPVDERVIPPEQLANTVGEFANAKVCEIYLVTEFLKRIGLTAPITIKDSWNVFAEFFCVVDQASLDIYWPKYARENEYRHSSYDAIKSSRMLTFAEWLVLYTQRESQQHIPEEVLQKKFGDTLEEDSHA